MVIKHRNLILLSVNKIDTYLLILLIFILIMILYHGTSIANAISILKNGFDFELCGSNWGNTYGHGIYFTPNYMTARFYAGQNGIVLSFNLNINYYKLLSDYSPSMKSKKMKKIIQYALSNNYDSIINFNQDEIIIINSAILT
tara:strand:- start:84 stop:512 length:429 start_codon:yes stop_codon:yes gene_type:complete